MENRIGKLLIVEDDVVVALDAETAAEKHGFVPVVTRSRGEALRLLERDRFRGALVDFQLADGNSADIACRLGAIGIPYVVVSGSPPDEIAKAGIDPALIVGKPARYESVIRELAEAPPRSGGRA